MRNQKLYRNVALRWKIALAFYSLATFVHGESSIDFSRDIRPILSDNCFKCHGPDDATREADLRLDTPDAAVADRGGYQAIVPKNPSASALLSRITTDDEAERMPPVDSGRRLSERQIALLRQWIEQGAPYDAHWSFRPIRQPETPDVNSQWVRNPIDAFVLERLEREKLAPSAEALRHTLIRRVYLDVLGLPPTPEQVDAYVSDQSPNAHQKMVDRALASPHYGERWGRHWLDQARYADTNGYSVDADRSMWPYRDWVIQAINDDMPFDQFTIQQLAGDLLPSATRDQLIATGFHRNTLINQEGGSDPEQFRVEAVVDRVNTTGAVWLGLTFACAQCHAHKFDPISQREYYSFFAFFNNCEDINDKNPEQLVATTDQQKKLNELDASIGIAKHAIANFEQSTNPSSEQLKTERDNLATELARLEKDRESHRATIPRTMILRERKQPRETHILIRGDFLRKAEPVSPGTPAVLPPLADMNSPRTRLDLARWLLSRENPLTARVTVNRVWAQYFGRGLVETEHDFGLQGTPPTHPELLDWLAAQFMAPADGYPAWSLKRLHRLILNSATYRQSSHHRDDLATVDPLNKLLGRQARLRVDAEVVRDVSLAVSGLLHDKIGGPSVYPPQPADVYTFTQVPRTWPTSTGPDRYRRAMYTFFARSAPYPMLTTFDSPVFNTTCTFRQRSNTPLQALTMANDETMIEAARALGKRIHEHADSDRGRLDYAFQLCFSRQPQAYELERLEKYASQQLQQYALAPDAARQLAGEAAVEPVVEAAAWTSVARVLLNVDEFITRE